MKKYIIVALLVVFVLGQLGTAIYNWPGNGNGDDNHGHEGAPGQFFGEPGNAEGHSGAPGQSPHQPGDGNGHAGAPGQE